MIFASFLLLFKLFISYFLFCILFIWILASSWDSPKSYTMAAIVLLSLHLRSSRMQLWMSDCSFTQHILNIHWSVYSAVWLLHGWCHWKHQRIPRNPKKARLHCFATVTWFCGMFCFQQNQSHAWSCRLINWSWMLESDGSEDVKIKEICV